MSTISSNNILNSPNSANNPQLNFQTKSPLYSNTKTKRPKFQASKPSYLLSGIASKLLLEIDNNISNNNPSKYKNAFSPCQKPTPLNTNNPPIQTLIPHKPTKPNLRLKTISVNMAKSNKLNDKRLKEQNIQNKALSKHKKQLSL